MVVGPDPLVLILFLASIVFGVILWGMQYLVVTKLLILLTVANGTPVVAKLLLGNRFSRPLDGNLELPDGRPLFGRSKTIRGVLLAVLATSVSAPLLGLDLGIGAIVGAIAMAGDLCSSFLKRRLGLAPSSRATGIDQIPESLFPLLACRHALSLTAIDILAVMAIFIVGEILLSRVLFRLHFRDRPY
jgi:CDP-diglyceride synthetase